MAVLLLGRKVKFQNFVNNVLYFPLENATAARYQKLREGLSDYNYFITLSTLINIKNTN